MILMGIQLRGTSAARPSQLEEVPAATPSTLKGAPLKLPLQFVACEFLGLCVCVCAVWHKCGTF